MTNQEKKEYLRRYRESELEIKRLQDELIRCQALATKITPTISDTPGGHGGDRLQAAVDRIAEIELQIDVEIGIWKQLRSDILDAISAVEDYRLRNILSSRYIRGDKWEQIAVDMHYDYRHITRLHGKALTALQIE